MKFEPDMSGDRLLLVLAALSNPHRLRTIAALATSGRLHVSALARMLGISRPLLHLHLARLVEAGLVAGSMEVSADGKARHFYEVSPFAISIDPRSVVRACDTLAATGGNRTERTDE